MHIFPARNNQGLTLIELLITIAVIAVIAAISIPVVTNVIDSSRARALAEMNTTVDDFLVSFSNGGAFLYSKTATTIAGIDVPARTFVGMIDLDGDGALDANEVIATLELDPQWTPIDQAGQEIVSAAPSGLVYPTTTNAITDATVNLIES